METTTLILASGSPRRRELLSLFHIPFCVVATDAEEEHHDTPDTIIDALPPFSLPHALHPSLIAWRKVATVAAQHPTAVIVGADTIVVLHHTPLMKPHNVADARSMLQQLAGTTHQVYTGICVLFTKENKEHLLFDIVQTHVTFAPLTSHDIDAYIATGEPMDKAGAYGIQGHGGQFVRHIDGSITSVVGLPLVTTHALLTAAGVALPYTPQEAFTTWIRGKEPLLCRINHL